MGARDRKQHGTPLKSTGVSSQPRKKKKARTTQNLFVAGKTCKRALHNTPKMAWIYIRLDGSLSEEGIQAFLTDNGIKKITLEELRTRGLNKSLKIGIPFKQNEMAYDLDLWPKGTVIHKKKKN